MEIPKKYSKWVHNKSGMNYTVIMTGNRKATKEGWSPITVCYTDENGDEWTRPLKEWLNSCTHIS